MCFTEIKRNGLGWASRRRSSGKAGSMIVYGGSGWLWCWLTTEVTEGKWRIRSGSISDLIVADPRLKDLRPDSYPPTHIQPIQVNKTLGPIEVLSGQGKKNTNSSTPPHDAVQRGTVPGNWKTKLTARVDKTLFDLSKVKWGYVPEYPELRPGEKLNCKQGEEGETWLKG